MSVKSVDLPPAHRWLDETRPAPAYDRARLTLWGSYEGFMPKAADPSLYFTSGGWLLGGVRCWMAGFGKSWRSTYGVLMIAEISDQSIHYGNGLIIMRDPQGGILKTSADHGDSGGSFYCQAPGRSTELVGVIVGYRAEEWRDRNRMQNLFAPIWSQP